MEIDKIKNICKELDIVPTKSKGQNFLINKNVVGDIIQTADLKKSDTVLEIGPGLGVMTFEMAGLARQVIAVELDKGLVKFLQKNKKTKKQENIKIIEGNFISLFDCLIIKLLGDKKYKVVANLPYQITSRVLRLLLGTENPPIEMVLMVQKEVGERICAKAGKMSVLSVMVQYYAEPEIIRVVGRENFWPVPEVDSVILKIKKTLQFGGQASKQENPPIRRASKKTKDINFFKIVKLGFLNRRKMLKNNLATAYDSQLVEKVLGEMNLDLKVRAQELSVEQWINLTEKIFKTDDI